MDLEVPLALVISTHRRHDHPGPPVLGPRAGPGCGGIVTHVTPRSPSGGDSGRVRIDPTLSDQCDRKRSMWQADRRGGCPGRQPARRGWLCGRWSRSVCPPGSLRHRLRFKAGFIPVRRGVYAVGHTHLSAEGRWMAAVLGARARAPCSVIAPPPPFWASARRLASGSRSAFSGRRTKRRSRDPAARGFACDPRGDHARRGSRSPSPGRTLVDLGGVLSRPS